MDNNNRTSKNYYFDNEYSFKKWMKSEYGKVYCKQKLQMLKNGK
jgi:hypothetical protein